MSALADCPELVLAIGANLAVIETLGLQIAVLERAALARARPRDDFQRLLGVHGIGKALGPPRWRLPVPRRRPRRGRSRPARRPRPRARRPAPHA